MSENNSNNKNIKVFLWYKKIYYHATIGILVYKKKTD